MKDHTIDSFIYAMKCGGEIEFKFDGKLYFIEPDNTSYKEEYTRFYLYDCSDENDERFLLNGGVDEIISFKLENKYSIKTDFDIIEIIFLL